ncbi:MAG: DUF1398 domain-containing protein [Bacteroidetes bacterium]|nr:DUF1398 domain-containing protein [Bacteroidota bacterium]
MFTIDQIKTAHSKVKSGADFPKYVQDLIALGVERYDTFVSDGHAEYVGKDNYTAKSDAKYQPLLISEKSEADTFKHNLKIHQQGQTDYMTFCKHSAEAGVEKWTVNTTDMTCIYYDKAGNIVLLETIPTV